MKIFRSLNEIEEFYFPESTKKEREKEFMRTATPDEIGKHWAQQSIEKIKKELKSI